MDARTRTLTVPAGATALSVNCCHMIPSRSGSPLLTNPRSSLSSLSTEPDSTIPLASKNSKAKKTSVGERGPSSNGAPVAFGSAFKIVHTARKNLLTHGPARHGVLQSGRGGHVLVQVGKIILLLGKCAVVGLKPMLPAPFRIRSRWIGRKCLQDMGKVAGLGHAKQTRIAESRPPIVEIARRDHAWGHGRGFIWQRGILAQACAKRRSQRRRRNHYCCNRRELGPAFGHWGAFDRYPAGAVE